MVSIGRGRGRGRGHIWAEGEEISLIKPGNSPSEDTDYINLIDIISTTNVESLLHKCDDIAKLVQAEAKKVDLQHMHNKLYKHALMNEEFGQRLMIVYTNPTIKKICDSEDKNIRYYLLRDFQLHFERREKFREENVVQFRNDICLLSKYLTQVITPYIKCHFIQSALLDYMDMLLETASADDIKVFTEQIAVHGANFYDCCREKVDDIMVNARRVLLEQDLPFTSRQMLLYAIDLHSGNFNPLPTKLLKFYKLQFEKKTPLFNFL